MSRMGSYAAFDSLYLVGHLTAGSPKITLPELHVFAYLACLLAVYDGRPVATWGYEFVATENTAPFSKDLLEATESLTSAGLFYGESKLYSLSDDGIQELSNWEKLRRFSDRRRYLRAATDTATALPVNAVAEGISHEPQISLANALNSPRPLLDDAGRTALHSHFEALEKALGRNVSDLIVPAIIWVTFLLDQGAEDASSSGSVQ